MDKEHKEVEEKDHQEEVSFQGTFMYLKFFLFTAGACYCYYLMHLKIVAKKEEQQAKFAGVSTVKDEKDMTE